MKITHTSPEAGMVLFSSLKGGDVFYAQGMGRSDRPWIKHPPAIGGTRNLRRSPNATNLADGRGLQFGENELVIPCPSAQLFVPSRQSLLFP